jgi:hypothetical protein
MWFVFVLFLILCKQLFNLKAVSKSGQACRLESWLRFACSGIFDPVSEADSLSPDKDIFHLSCNFIVHYYIRKNPPLFPTLSQFSHVHILTPYFFSMLINIILPCTSIRKSSKWSLSFGFPDLSLYAFIIRANCPAHLILLVLILLK